MTTLLEGLRQWVEAALAAWGYAGIALVMLIENIMPPIPSELVVPFAGSLVRQGKLEALPVLLAATFGAVLGASALYGLGAWLGEERVMYAARRWGRWLLLSEADVGRAMAFFRRFDRAAVFWARLLPGVRSLISIPAGVARMPLGAFLLFTTLGSLLWNSLLLSAGLLLAGFWTEILHLIDIYESVLWWAVALAVVWWLARRLLFVRLL